MSNGTLELIQALETVVMETRERLYPPRGTCAHCGFEVELTPKGYVRSHAVYTRYVDDRAVCIARFRWGLLGKAEVQGTYIVRCPGSGNRPRRERAAA